MPGGGASFNRSNSNRYTNDNCCIPVMPHKSRAPSDGTGQLSLRLYLCVKLPGGIPTTTELLAVQITHTIFRICCNGSGKTITLLFIWQQAQDARLAEHGKVQVESTLRDTRLTLGSPWPSGLLLNISIVTISNHFSKQFCTHQKVCLFFFLLTVARCFVVTVIKCRLSG